MSDSVVGKVIFNVFRISCLLVSLILFAFSYFASGSTREKLEWNKTTGIIVSSQLNEYDIPNNRFNAYDLDVRYAYLVNNKKFYNNGLYGQDINLRSYDKQLYQKKAKKYQRGNYVEVFYNPNNPNQAYLEMPYQTGSMRFYELSVFMLICSVAMFFVGPVLALFRYFTKQK